MNIIEAPDNERPTLVLWVIENGQTVPIIYTQTEPTKPCGFTAEV